MEENSWLHILILTFYLFIMISEKIDILEKSIQFILYPLWDLGFNVGHATRSIKQASEFSKKDHTVRTSMLDARLICGSKTHFEKVIKVFKKDVTKK